MTPQQLNIPITWNEGCIQDQEISGLLVAIRRANVEITAFCAGKRAPDAEKDRACFQVAAADLAQIRWQPTHQRPRGKGTA